MTLSLSSLSRLLLVCTAKMLHGVYRIGGKAPLPPPALCCRLPDCWSIKIIVMEIDLIDNVPRSHCEQLVPCEHNPGTSSKNFSPQTSNPSSSFCPSLQKMKTEGCQGRQNPHLSSTSKTGRHVKWGGGGRLRNQNRGTGGQTWLRCWGGWRIDRNIHLLKIQPSSLCLIGKDLILVLGVLCSHDYTPPERHARRGGIWQILLPMRVACGLALDLAPCLKAVDGTNKRTTGEEG